MRVHNICYDFLPKFDNQLAHLASTDRVKPAQRHVEKNNFRLVYQRLRQSDALKHSFGKLAKLFVPIFFVQPDAPQQIFNALFSL